MCQCGAGIVAGVSGRRLLVPGRVRLSHDNSLGADLKDVAQIDTEAGTLMERVALQADQLRANMSQRDFVDRTGIHDTFPSFFSRLIKYRRYCR